VLRLVALIFCVFPLSVGTLLLWQQRFKRQESGLQVTLENLIPISQRAKELFRGNGREVVRMDAAPTGAEQVAIFAIPYQEPPECLHIRIHALSKELLPGANPWENGRTIIEWHDPQGMQPISYQPINSAQFDTVDKSRPFVIKAAFPGAIPRLRIEHLGDDGTYEVRQLILQPVNESDLWKFGSQVLVVFWLAWVVMLSRNNKKPALWRGLLTGMIFVTMGYFLAVPGPWKIIRPLGLEFNLAEKNFKSIATSDVSPSKIDHAPVAILGKMDVQGSFLFKVKLYLSAIRPVLHGILFMVPAFIVAWLIGKKISIILLIIITLVIEISQVLFGYGFDLLDVFDIIFDVSGIALGIWMYSKMSSHIYRRLPRHFPQPA